MRLPLPQVSSSDRPQNHIAEVIETATTEFLAQCLEPEDLGFPIMPAFGSFVRSLGITPGLSAQQESTYWVYAVVYHATTTPIDSIHRARALGLSLEQLKEEQPQIFAMLKTEFRAAIVGFETIEPSVGVGTPKSLLTNQNIDKTDKPAPHSQSSKVYQHLPPRPPQIHQAVYQCSAAEVLRFSEKFDFIRILLEIPGTPVDALISAALRAIYQLRPTERSWLVEAGRNLSLLVKDDYDRLRYILSQVYL